MTDRRTKSILVELPVELVEEADREARRRSVAEDRRVTRTELMRKGLEGELAKGKDAEPAVAA